jgi:Methyltransferase domain
MPKNQLSIDDYVAKSINTVEGYLTGLDARLIATLLQHQSKTGVLGSLCEIGVHHGKLFFLLALARQSNEKALAIDLFEDDAINTNTRHAGRDRALFINARRLGIDLSEAEKFKTSSLEIKFEEILNRTGGPVRFFSVDGSHLYEPVVNDLQLAERSLCPDGIIAVDDFFNLEWPDVTFAAYDFLRHSSADLTPFALTPSKLYLAPRPAAESYKEALESGAALGQVRRVQFLGREVLTLRQRLAEKGYEAMRRLVSRRA